MTISEQLKPCAKCKAPTDTLALFPGNLCLTCWTPIGEAQFRTMTAGKLARMWGAK